MEPKDQLLAHLTQKYGPESRVELETTQGYCMKMYVKKHYQYVVFMWENSKGSEVHCYYIHRLDMVSVRSKKFPEYQAYREQSIQQLFRRYAGSRSDFVDIGKAYIQDAVWRMDGYKAMGGLRKPVRGPETFANMKWFNGNVFEPKLPAEKTREELELGKEQKRKEAWKRSQLPLTELQKKIHLYLKMRLSRGSKGAKKRFV